MLKINPSDLYFDVNGKCRYSAPLEFIPEVWLSVRYEKKKKLKKSYVNQSFKAGQNDLDIFNMKVKIVESWHVTR